MAVHTMTINQLTLQPGESITVDAEQYYIFYKGENITDQAVGEWVDALHRNAFRIDITPNASSISSEITYSERYL